jgi:hypothetical protein
MDTTTMTDALLHDADGEMAADTRAEIARDPLPGSPQIHHSRRLSDKLLIAFHHSCDVDELDIAGGLLDLLEKLLCKPPRPWEVNRRRGRETLVAAHERLWHLRHRAG